MEESGESEGVQFFDYQDGEYIHKGDFGALGQAEGFDQPDEEAKEVDGRLSQDKKSLKQDMQEEEAKNLSTPKSASEKEEHKGSEKISKESLKDDPSVNEAVRKQSHDNLNRDLNIVSPCFKFRTHGSKCERGSSKLTLAGNFCSHS